MSESLDNLLKQAGDFELCNGAFKLLLHHHGSAVSPEEMNEVERAILLTWHAKGIIDNGGFQYLFEGNFDGDPYFERTAVAFQTIGCLGAAEAFRKAFSFFPEGKRPTNINRRLKEYQSGPGPRRGEIDNQFWEATSNLEELLAAFIRSHSEELTHLDGPPKATGEQRAPVKPEDVADED